LRDWSLRLPRGPRRHGCRSSSVTRPLLHTAQARAACRRTKWLPFRPSLLGAGLPTLQCV
jgi:hypothetical protein